MNAHFRSGLTRAAVVLVAIVTGRPVIAVAQERPQPVAEIAVGTLVFPEAVETFGGGTVRFYVLPRVSVGPEFTYVSGDRHSHVIWTGNLTFDVIRGPRGQRRWTPFLVAGGGLYQTREHFFTREVYTSTEGAVTAGGGVRGRVGRRVHVGAEARFGTEPHLRLNGFVGVQLGR